MWYHDREHICEEEGCSSTDTVECSLTIYKSDIYPTSLWWILKTNGLKSLIEYLRHGYTDTYDYYCPKHCQKNGYCYGCGNFWAGVENFDFGNGLCSNCQGDLGEDDYYDDDPDYYDYYIAEEYYPEEEYPDEE